MTPDAKKIRLTQDKETYLTTLYGKALDAGAANPILGDHLAAEAVARLDCDFKALKLPRGGEVSLPVRARHFDQWTRAFLAAHPESTVLHLGCGLDTRVYRINPGPKVRWYDVDMPDVIALREQLYPEREGYHRVKSSVTEPAWLKALPGDTPVLVVAEGLIWCHASRRCGARRSSSSGESMIRMTSRSRSRGCTSSRTCGSSPCPSWSTGSPRVGSHER